MVFITWPLVLEYVNFILLLQRDFFALSNREHSVSGYIVRRKKLLKCVKLFLTVDYYLWLARWKELFLGGCYVIGFALNNFRVGLCSTI